MIDALGRPQSVLLLGGTSEIALAVLEGLPAQRLRRVVLAVRDPDAGKAVAASIEERLPAAAVEVVRVEAADVAVHGAVLDAVFDAGDVDVTVLAVGALGDQAASLADPRLAADLATSTYTGPLSLLLHVSRRLQAQGHGVVVVLSSLASQAARPANFVYGSAKAGLDHAALGVMDSLHGTGARLLLVRPGFVRSRMTAHLRTPPLAVRPADVAAAVAAALPGPSRVLHVPRVGRLLGAGLRLAPRAVTRRLPL